MEFITTQKSGESLIWHGCKFTLKMANGKRYWRCERGAAQLELQQREMKSCKKTNGHNHHEDVLVDLATNLVENKNVASKLPTFPSLKSSLYRARQSRLPPLP